MTIHGFLLALAIFVSVGVFSMLVFTWASLRTNYPADQRRKIIAFVCLALAGLMAFIFAAWVLSV